VVMNVAYAAGAYPAGALADSLRPKSLLLCGIGILIVADIVLALSAGLAGVFLGIALWGAHLALTQGLLSKLVADTAPTALRGTAFGVFNLATGAALLIASVSAGLLWDAFGSAMTFFAGGAIALVAALLLLLWNDRPSTPR